MNAETHTTHTLASTESRNWAVVSHLSALIMFAGFPSPLGPLAIWLLKRDDPHVSRHAVDALNFNLSFAVYAIAAGMSMLLLIGFVLLPAVLLTWVVLVIFAAIKASNEEPFEYPFTIRFIGNP